MKKRNLLLLFLMLGLAAFLFAPGLFAANNEAMVNNEEMDADGEEVALIGLGVVAKVEAGKLVLVEYEYESDAELEVAYEINANTQFDNIGSLNELQIGDSVEVVYADQNGKKEALSISKEENYIEDDQFGVEEGVPVADNQEVIDVLATETITNVPANATGE